MVNKFSLFALILFGIFVGKLMFDTAVDDDLMGRRPATYAQVAKIK